MKYEAQIIIFFNTIQKKHFSKIFAGVTTKTGKGRSRSTWASKHEHYQQKTWLTKGNHLMMSDDDWWYMDIYMWSNEENQRNTCII